MDQRYNIANDFLEISVRKTGAELCAIKKLPDGKDYLWDANPKIWAGYAPVLFPIIGALKEDSYYFKGKRYTLNKHGFVRNNANIELYKSSDTSLIFTLTSNPETLKFYPFQFEFYISYTLEKNAIIVDHLVKNTGDETLFFSVGGHPAFRCPLEKDEKYSDYSIVFEHNETAHNFEVMDSGTIGPAKDLILNNSSIIHLHYAIFSNDALVFKNLKSRKASLVSKRSGKRVEVSYEGFPYLGIWAKPHADYVCIEPWLGIADPVDTDQELETKEGIIPLSGMKSFSASYRISIF